MIVIRSNTKLRFVATAAACAVVGAVAGIAAAGASPSTHTTSTSTTIGRGAWPGPGRPPGLGREPVPLGYGGFLGPAVHETAVVLNKAGTGYITVTEDSGTLQSVSGDQLTIKEGVGKVTYKVVTLTIPTTATVYRDFSKSKLSSLKSGDRVRVVQSSEGTDVVAIDASATGFGPWHGKRFLPGRHAGQFMPGGRAGAAAPALPGGPTAPGGPPIA